MFFSTLCYSSYKQRSKTVNRPVVGCNLTARHGDVKKLRQTVVGVLGAECGNVEPEVSWTWHIVWVSMRPTNYLHAHIKRCTWYTHSLSAGLVMNRKCYIVGTALATSCKPLTSPKVLHGLTLQPTVFSISAHFLPTPVRVCCSDIFYRSAALLPPWSFWFCLSISHMLHSDISVLIFNYALHVYYGESWRHSSSSFLACTTRSAQRHTSASRVQCDACKWNSWLCISEWHVKTIVKVKQFQKSKSQNLKVTTTTTTTTILRPFVRDYLGEPVSEEKLTHPPSWSSSNLYQLLPSTTIHNILLVRITCLAIFLHNLFPCPLWSTSWSGALHLIFHTFLKVR